MSYCCMQCGSSSYSEDPDVEECECGGNYVPFMVWASDKYRQDAVVFLTRTKQYGIVDRVTGFGVRVCNIGIVPFDELRLADDRESVRFKTHGQQVLKQFEF